MPASEKHLPTSDRHFIAVITLADEVFNIDNPGLPHWWPGFCLAFDALLGALLAVRLIRHPKRVS